MRKTITGLTLVVLVGWAAAQPAQAPAEKPVIRVGGWNIEWLGQPGKRNSKKPQKPEDLARYIGNSRVDVLTLNEICQTNLEAGPPTNLTMDQTLTLLRQQSGQEWKYELFPKEDPKDRDQLLGVVWNAAKVTRQGPSFKLPVRRPKPDPDFIKRAPYAAKFSAGPGKTDFVVIPVHMKSNRGGDDVMSKQRGEEMKAIIRSLAPVQNNFSDDDLIVIGDCNTKSPSETCLSRMNMAGFRDLNAAGELTWIKSGRYSSAPFDRIFVPDDQPEFGASKMTVFKDHGLESETAFRDLLSDHYMVRMEIDVMDDDD